MFKEVPNQFDFPAMEKEIRAFWEANNIYEKSLERRKGGKPFVFFEGPPTANGLPHPGHCLTRAIKDLFPRFKTMTGHYVLRKGGWDTHGLPVEVEVCKELGIHTKEEIEAYGVEAFNRKCLESVFRYTKEWEELTKRLGFWVNLEEAYVTYHQSYIESVWWSLKQLFDAGLLYQGHKIVWWWAQGGTALSSGEVGQGYREVDDPSVFVRFPLVENQPHKTADAISGFVKTSLLVWTTTPWTLPSNMFAAVHKDFDYAVVHDEETGERLIFAAALVDSIAKKVKKTEKWTVENTVKGQKLINLRYRPPFHECYYDRTRNDPCLDGRDPNGDDLTWDVSAWDRTLGECKRALKNGSSEHIAWRVLHANFVTLESGTGLVHEAPAFGEVDFDLFEEEIEQFEIDKHSAVPLPPIPLLCAVGPNGAFRSVVDKYKGRFVKECDKDIIRDLKERGLLLHQEQYRHDYPFCWRAEEDPLIQYPRRSWFIRTTQFKDAMLANNSRINWLPEHIKEGRFGNFLRDNVDWSLSRERYWGTPLPIWVCESCGHMEAIESYTDLLGDAEKGVEPKPGLAGNEVWENAKKKEPTLSDHLKVHKPYIDAITYDCPKCAANEPRAQARGSDTQPPLAGARGSLPNEARAIMRRVPEVIDCWYDSGAMPFAQWGFPHKNHEQFFSQFPADFISEALDQTRGWFYSLTAISVMLFGSEKLKLQTERSIQEARASGVSEEKLKFMEEAMGQWSKLLSDPNAGAARSMSMAKELDGSIHSLNVTAPYPLPFRNCIVLGLLLGEDGLKMSKSKKNYKEPTYIFEHEGADAMRWLFFSGQTPWTSIRFQESAIAEGQREFLIRLYNCYSFFVIYANIDKWTPSQGSGLTEGYEFDNWIRSEMAACSVTVFEKLNEYDNYGAARSLNAFVDALSNWYVRRSRDRFWKSGMDDDKRSAYETLHHCLVTVAKLIAPFTPFIAESIYQNLVRTHDPSQPESIHLCDYPVTHTSLDSVRQSIRADVNKSVDLVRELVSYGRALRAKSGIRIRQPVNRMWIYHFDDMLGPYDAVIREELNIKQIIWIAGSELPTYVDYELKLDFKKAGPKYGKLAPKIKAFLAALADVNAFAIQLSNDRRCEIVVEHQAVQLDADDVLFELHGKAGLVAERIPGHGILVLDTKLTPELVDEGMARDIVNQIQQVRKNLNLKYEQRIELAVVGDADIQRVLSRFGETIMSETLAKCLLTTPLRDAPPTASDVDGRAVQVYVKPL